MTPAFLTAVTRPPSTGAFFAPSSSLSLELLSLLAAADAVVHEPASSESLEVMRFAMLLKQSDHQLSHWSSSALRFSAPKPVFSCRLVACTQSMRPFLSLPKPWPSFQ